MNNDDLEFYRDEITRNVMEAFSPVIDDIEWDEKRQMWKVGVELYGIKDKYVWVGIGGDVYFNDDFNDDFREDDFEDDDNLDMDLEV